MIRSTTLALASLLLAAAGCNNDEDIPDARIGDAGLFGDAGPSDGGAADASGPDATTSDAGPATVSLRMRGDTTGDGTLTNAQTPTDFSLTISRIDLMTGDGQVATVLDQPVTTTLGAEATLGSFALASLPAGTYTRARLWLDHGTFTVDAVAHADAFTDTGRLTLTAALSATVIDGQAWPKGRVHASWQGTVTAELDTEMPPFAGEGVMLVEEDPSSMRVLVDLASPLVVGDTLPGVDHVTFTFLLGDAFRWRDESTSGFAADTWDISAMPNVSESVTAFGPRAATAAFE